MPSARNTVSKRALEPVAANIWVDTSGGSCNDVDSPIAYPNDGTECGSMNAAVVQAEPGDIIGVRAGTYSGETINYRAALDGLTPACDPYGEWGAASSVNCVKIIPDGGNVIFTSQLGIRSPSIWLNGTATGTAPDFPSRTYNIIVDEGGGSGFTDTATCGVGGNPPCRHGNIRIDSAASGQTANHITIEGTHSHTFEIVGGENILFRDADVGPNWMDNNGTGGSADSPENKIYRDNNKNINARDITLERVFIHGQNRTSDCAVQNACHSGGMIFYTSATGIRFRNTAWLANIVYNVIFDGNGAVLTDFAFENNYFGCTVEDAAEPTTCAAKTSFDIKVDLTNWLVRYNAFYDNPTLRAGATMTNVRWIGNIYEPPGSTNPFCTAAGITKDYNVSVVTSGTCGGTNNASGGLRSNVWTNPSSTTAPDFHLLNATTAANDLVVPTTTDYALNKDFENQSRPQGTNRDAGADEFYVNQAPTVPGNLRQVSATQTSISVAWDPATDDVAVAGYKTYREGTFIADVGNVLTYNYAGLTCGASYLLEVSAYDGPGLEGPRAALTASTSPCAAPPPVFHGAQSGSFANLGGYVLNRPSGAVVGDLLIAIVATDEPHTISTVPAGWTQVGTTQVDGSGSGSDSSSSVFRHVYAAGDPNAWTGTFVSGTRGASVVLAYGGASTVEAFAQGTGSGTSLSGPPVSPLSQNALVVALWGADPNFNPETATAMAPAVERDDSQNGTYGKIYAEDLVVATPAPTSLSSTWSAAETVAVFSLVIR